MADDIFPILLIVLVTNDFYLVDFSLALNFSHNSLNYLFASSDVLHISISKMLWETIDLLFNIKRMVYLKNLSIFSKVTGETIIFS